MNAPDHEHEHRDQLTEDVFYPDHPPRAESRSFIATKKAGHAAKLPCAISGRTDGTEYHHLFCEWAFSGAVDWVKVKAIALGELKVLPVLDLETDQPTDETFAAEHSLVWMLCKLAEARGFDWRAFDPAQPETFVDSMENMLVLHSKFHRHRDHGIHEMSFPEWIFQAFPRVAGFVFTPDEVAHAKAA
ncbi:hypothetical protein [Paludibacterium yongneupense]|uniref:hypothetical protein n=1 Tax=Paludibacterium yongneupense TaxID=400061 RepID=UPI0004116A4B|nr:hypothetical protein [Paludibacterium yongneupense]